MTDGVRFYQVGGHVRDELMGFTSKDIDFAVEAPSFDVMKQHLLDSGYDIFLESPEFLTVRARFPRDRLVVFADRKMGGVTADFVLCRKDGVYTDGRRPDTVTPGTLADDLARRDFTVNAIAKDQNGVLIDPHNGRSHINEGILRAVGAAEERLREDALRALRALRFRVTRGFQWDFALTDAMRSCWLPDLLVAVSVERRREELSKMFKYNTNRALFDLAGMPPAFRDAVFDGGIRLLPSLAQ